MRNLFEQAFKELGFSLTEVMATPNFTRKVEQELMLGQLLSCTFLVPVGSPPRRNSVIVFEISAFIFSGYYLR